MKTILVVLVLAGIAWLVFYAWWRSEAPYRDAAPFFCRHGVYLGDSNPSHPCRKCRRANRRAAVE